MQAAEHLHDHEHLHEDDHDHSAERWQEWGKVLILLGLAGYFAFNIVSNNLTNYINVRFAWLAYVAAVIFGLLGGVRLIALLKAEDHHNHHDPEGHDHTHGSLPWSVLAVVSIPLLLGTLIPSQPLGAEAVTGGVSLTGVGVASASTFTKDPSQRNVLDWLRVFRDGQPAEFDGQQADVIGFVYREPNFGENRAMVARFAISCCVADATAFGLPVEWQGLDAIADGEWVRVEGIFQAGTFHDVSTPILMASSVEVVEQPDPPYLYP